MEEIGYWFDLGHITNSVEPTNSSLGSAPGRAFLKVKAWVLFREHGKYREKPTALQSGSALTESQGYLFIRIPPLPLKSLTICMQITGSVSLWEGWELGAEALPGVGEVEANPPWGGCHLPMAQWEKDDMKGCLGTGAKGDRCPTRPQSFCSCCQSATPRAHWVLASTGDRNAQWSLDILGNKTNLIDPVSSFGTYTLKLD